MSDWEIERAERYEDERATTPTPVPSEVAETTAGGREALVCALADWTRPNAIAEGVLASDWLAALLDRVRREEGAKAWDAGHRHRQRRGPDECQCGAYYDGECGCGKYGSGPLVSLKDNPYRAASVGRGEGL